MGFAIAGRHIGPHHPPYLVAEVSANHLGGLARALEIVESAAAAGADAVKLQTYTANTLTIDHDGPGFRVQGGPWHGRTLHDLYREAHTPWEWHEAIFARCRELGVTAFSSAFDPTAVRFLEGLGAPAYKIASFELVDLPLIEQVAATGKPLIVSTGLASRDEIAQAVAAARGAGCVDLAVLHCVSGYPTPPQDANLRTLGDLADGFGVTVGLSDHTLGTAVATAAVALGAAIVEKHVTLRRADGGPDAAFSAEPGELAALRASCDAAWSALGAVSYERAPSEAPNAAFRRSLYVVEDVAAGEPFTVRNVRSIRPAHGMAPSHLPEVLGRPASRAVRRGTPLDPSLLES